jgi:hypothetical protein
MPTVSIRTEAGSIVREHRPLSVPFVLAFVAATLCGQVSAQVGVVSFADLEFLAEARTQVRSLPDFPGGPTTLENDAAERLASGSPAMIQEELRSRQVEGTQAEATTIVDAYADEFVIRLQASIETSAGLLTEDNASASGAVGVSTNFTVAETTVLSLNARFVAEPDSGSLFPPTSYSTFATYSLIGIDPNDPFNFVFEQGTLGGPNDFGSELSFFDVITLEPGVQYTLTMNANTGASVERGATEAFSVTRGEFVFSANFGDRDADGLLDVWEAAGGIDVDSDGSVDINLPDADPDRKNIYVEIDLAADTEIDLNWVADVGQVFQNAPADLVNNPDGSQGIIFRTFIDETLPDFPFYDPNEQPNGRYAELARFSNAYRGLESERNAPNRDLLLEARSRAFRYCLWGGVDADDGDGFAELPGDQFAVSLDGFNADRSRDNQASTFIHELGHTLGLRHGGVDDINYKPNFFSNMNYARAFPGPYFQLDYSRHKLPPLREDFLVEPDGLGTNLPSDIVGLPFQYTSGFDAEGEPVILSGIAGQPVDWDNDGATNSITFADVNAQVSNPPGRLSYLASAVDWSRLQIPIRGDSGNYGYLAGGGFQTGGGQTSDRLYGTDKPADLARLFRSLNPCDPDYDADGEATFFDLITFARMYDRESPRADRSGDSELTPVDLADLIEALQKGCP